MKGVLSVKDFAEKVKSGEYIVVDLRTDEERKEQGYIKWTSKFCDVRNDNILQKLVNQDRDDKYLIYCFAGNRSAAVYNIMTDYWFKNVEQLEWGFNAWRNSWMPVEYN